MDLVPVAGLAQVRLGINRLDPHGPQQPHPPLAIDPPALLAQGHTQLAAPLDRMGQMQLVQPPHQGQVLRGLRARFVVVGAAGQTQQLALVPQADRGRRGNELAQACQRPSCRDFFLSQSRSTVSCPIF